tara:strand:+ start:18760 stop:19206 length:447 start_codon:yes stop_codon:yes gene_type:complete
MPIPIELRVSIETYTELREKFTVDDIRKLYDHLIEDGNIYRDHISDIKFKAEVIKFFEDGNVPGYCAVANPYVTESGPTFRFEFIPNNPMADLNMLEVPDEFKRLTCKIHPYYKEFLEFLSSESGVSQDMIARSLLTRSLALVMDYFK